MTKNNKGYDMGCVELCWLTWIIIICVIIKKYNRKKLPLFFIALLMVTTNSLVSPILYVIVTSLTIFIGNKEFHAENTRSLFNKCLYPVFTSGNKFPENPTIILANYPANYIEYLSNHLLPIKKKCILLYKKAVIQSRLVKLFYTDDEILFVGKGNEFDETQRKVKDKLSKGYNIIVYPEKNFFNRKNKYDITNLRSGLFTIAKNINSTITPIVFDHIDHNFGLIINKNFKIYIDKTRKVKDVDFEIDSVSKLFKRKLSHFKIK